MRILKIAAIVTALFALAAVGTAQSKPDFSGSWKLDTTKSDFGPIPAPSNSTMKVDHQEPKVNAASHAETDQGNQDIDLKFATDGTETKNQLNGPMGSAEIKSTGRWDGSAIQLVSKISSDMGELTITDKWSLSDDGKVLTIDRVWTSPQGEATQKLVHKKQ